MHFSPNFWVFYGAMKQNNAIVEYRDKLKYFIILWVNITLRNDQLLLIYLFLIMSKHLVD